MNKRTSAEDLKISNHKLQEKCAYVKLLHNETIPETGQTETHFKQLLHPLNSYVK